MAEYAEYMMAYMESKRKQIATVPCGGCEARKGELCGAKLPDGTHVRCQDKCCGGYQWYERDAEIIRDFGTYKENACSYCERREDGKCVRTNGVFTYLCADKCCRKRKD